MKYFGIALIVGAGFLLFQPQLLSKIPLPQDVEYEDKLVTRFLKTCDKKVATVVNTYVKNKGGLTPQQFSSLLVNPNFKTAFCQCQGDIIRHERMIPSAYLPKAIAKPMVRKLASTMKTHLKSRAGHKQINYCYVHAWTKASFAP